MAHVDYQGWARYVVALLERHHASARDVLELGCGTASLALELQPLGSFRYTASDASEEMLKIARQKINRARLPITLTKVDFRQIPGRWRTDVVLLLYDGINYLTEPEELASVLDGAFGALRPGGLFILDHSTPENSLNNADAFDDAGRGQDGRYLRTSSYDAAERIHTTRFRLESGGRSLTETHRQRSYDVSEMTALVDASPLVLEAAYDGFSTEPATEASERIHLVLRRPARG